MKQEKTADFAIRNSWLEADGNRTYLLITLGFVTAILWIVFAQFVMPAIIGSVYRGESFSLLNRAIKGQAEFPLEHYLQKWDSISMQVLWSGLAFWMLTLLTTSEGFFRQFVGEATPGTLGAIRMWTCAILLVTTLWEDLGSVAVLPLGYREDMGLMKILDELAIGFDRFLTNESALRLFQRATELLLFLGVIGWRTWIVVPLCAVSAFVLNGILREYSGFWHQNLVPIYVLAVLSFTPCGDGWSIDRLWKIFQGKAVPGSEKTSPVYGWARYACWVPIALTYAAAGLSKLRADGLYWMSATNMRTMLYEQTLYPRAGNYSISLFLASAPDIVFVLLGVAALCGELFFITVLFSRTARRFFPAISILMHIGIVFLQNIVFFDLMLLLLIFYDFSVVRKRIGNWLARAGRIQILYDGTCSLCQRTVRILASLDLFRRLEFQDFRRLDLTEFNHTHTLDLTQDAVEKEMFVISRGKNYSGFEGYRIIALAVPLLWPVVPGLFLPGVSTLGRSVYRIVARRRHSFLTCASDCSTESLPRDDPKLGSPTKTRRHTLGYSVATAAVIAVMGTFWFHRIEYYPFTAVQMFVNYKGPIVRYYKTLGHRESGGASRIYLEDTLNVMSINSRYERLFDLCFGDAQDVDLCKQTLSVLGSAYNKKVPASEKLTELEIQRWKWDFGSHPRDPNYGNLDTRIVAQISTGAPPQGNATSVTVKQ
jgi:predicted DCC family thiol-disulfide oxidoreductase YuxK